MWMQRLVGRWESMEFSGGRARRTAWGRTCAARAVHDICAMKDVIGWSDQLE